MTRDDVRTGDIVMGRGRLASYGPLTLVEVDGESLELEAAGRGVAGVTFAWRGADGIVVEGYAFLDNLDLLKEAKG
jgi:hypothetical protein